MPEQVLIDTGIWIAGRDYAGVSNSVTLTATAATPEKTVFKGGWREMAEGGLKTSAFSLEGFFDTLGPDAEQFSSLGGERSAMVVPAGMDPGDVAYIVPVRVSGHQLGGSIGELLAFTYAAVGDGALVRAQVMDIREGVAANVATPRLQLGDIPSGQTLHVWVHVDQGAGDLKIDLVSSPNAMGAPVATRRTQSNIIGDGLYILNVGGVVTDEYWYLDLTPTGANASFDIAAASFFAAQNTIAIPLRPPITPPPVGTVTVKGGLSASAMPVESDFTIDGVNHVLSFPAFTNMRLLIWRLESQGDLTSIVIGSDQTQANVLGGWMKYGSTVDVGTDTGNVWVSNQLLTFPASDTIVTG